MKQKGIVLLITLFFISAISILILTNLEDSESFIDEISYDSKLTQLKITNQNVQEEIISIIKKNIDYIDEIRKESQTFPLSYGSVNLVINLEEYLDTGCNINKLKSEQDIFMKCGDEIAYKITNKYQFIKDLNSLEENNTTRIETKQQLEYFLNNYKKSVNDYEIDDIQNQFTYVSIDKNSTDNNEPVYLKCDYTISVDEIKANAQFIFKADDGTIKSSYFSLR